MAVMGLGTDIVEIARFETTGQQTEHRLAKRVLTDTEYQVYAQHKMPARYLAKRFAAKEAAVKALGTGIGNGVGWQQLAVENDELGRPYLVLSGHFAELCQQRGITRSHLSISDEKHYATATVILESEG